VPQGSFGREAAVESGLLRHLSKEVVVSLDHLRCERGLGVIERGRGD